MVESGIRFEEIRPGHESFPIEVIQYVPLAYRAIYTNIVLARETHRINPDGNGHASYAMSLVAMYHMFIDQMMCDTLSRVFDLRFPDYGKGDYPDQERATASRVLGLSLSSGKKKFRKPTMEMGPKIDEYARAMDIGIRGSWRDRFLAFCDMRDFLYHNICVRQRSGSLPTVVARYCDALGIEQIPEDAPWPEAVFSIDAMERLISFIESEIIPRLALSNDDPRSTHCRFNEFDSGNILVGASAHLRDRCKDGILEHSLVERYKLGSFAHYTAFRDLTCWIRFPDGNIANGVQLPHQNWLVKRSIRKILRGMDRRLDSGQDTTVHFPGKSTLWMNDDVGSPCRSISITENGNILCTGDLTSHQFPRHKIGLIYLNAKAAITKDFFMRLKSYNIQTEFEVEVTCPDGIKRPGIIRFTRPNDETNGMDDIGP